jgi:hypothetical protein
MVHTLPDGTTKYRMVKIFGQIDSGELAARLGSIVTFDRRGNVVLMDNFESSTLKWRTTTNGTGAAIVISTGAAVSGDSSCKLTAGEGELGIAGIVKYVHPKILGKLGFEFSFTVDDDTESVRGTFAHFNGTTRYSSVVTYDHVNSKLMYTDNVAGNVDIATGVTLEDILGIFHTMKIVIDSSTNKPVRLLVNEDTYDLSAYTAKQQGGSGGEWVQIGVSHFSDHASVKSIYIDNAILTQNEF